MAAKPAEILASQAPDPRVRCALQFPTIALLDQSHGAFSN